MGFYVECVEWKDSSLDKSYSLYGKGTYNILKTSFIPFL